MAATTPQMYDEIARILRVTRNNVEYEAERNKSQLLCDVAATIDNLTTLVHNISTELKTAHEKESDAFVIACDYIINNDLADDFSTYLNVKGALSSGIDNTYNNAYNFFMKRFTKRV